MILDCMESLNQEGNPINVVFVGKDVDNVGLDIIAKRKDSINKFGYMDHAMTTCY